MIKETFKYCTIDEDFITVSNEEINKPMLSHIFLENIELCYEQYNKLTITGWKVNYDWYIQRYYLCKSELNDYVASDLKFGFILNKPYVKGVVRRNQVVRFKCVKNVYTVIYK